MGRHGGERFWKASLLAAKDALLELREDGSTAEMIIIAASLAV